MHRETIELTIKRLERAKALYDFAGELLEQEPIMSPLYDSLCDAYFKLHIYIKKTEKHVKELKNNTVC